MMEDGQTFTVQVEQSDNSKVISCTLHKFSIYGRVFLKGKKSIKNSCLQSATGESRHNMCIVQETSLAR